MQTEFPLVIFLLEEFDTVRLSDMASEQRHCPLYFVFRRQLSQDCQSAIWFSAKF